MVVGMDGWQELSLGKQREHGLKDWRERKGESRRRSRRKIPVFDLGVAERA